LLSVGPPTKAASKTCLLGASWGGKTSAYGVGFSSENFENWKSKCPFNN
jgi:hypothetical protein